MRDPARALGLACMIEVVPIHHDDGIVHAVRIHDQPMLPGELARMTASFMRSMR